MKIAIEGCCHGELDSIYGSIRLVEQRENCKIDLVLICGDFQALRNEADMECMSVPDKYKSLGTFWKYYSGKVRAPYPTIFIGGNHEASNYLWELYHGGWVCENIYYLGHSGVINFGGLRIGGLSGIAKGHYEKGHYETAPYNKGSIKSVYHVREYDVRKLLAVAEPIDVFMSHDWPRGVERYGDLEDLLNRKRYFRDEVMTNSLGSKPNEEILSQLQPSYWFAAHLHVHYAAIVNHEMWKNAIYPPAAQAILGIRNNVKPVQVERLITEAPTLPTDCENQQEKTPFKEENDERKTETTPKCTKFLSLDKCLPGRRFLQIIDVLSPNDESGNYDFYYDMEWLAITRAMQPYLCTTEKQAPLPGPEELKEIVKNERVNLEKKQQSGALDLKIPHNFEPTAPPFDPSKLRDQQEVLNFQYPFLNPQTLAFCNEIGIENKVNSGCRTGIDDLQALENNYNMQTAHIPNAPQNGAITAAETPVLPVDVQVDATFIDSNLQPTKRLKTEDIQSEIIIDEDEFL